MIDKQPQLMITHEHEEFMEMNELLIGNPYEGFVFK